MPDTPDTLNDMLLGYSFGLTIIFILAASIWWRYRSLAADEQAVDQLEVDIQQDSQPAQQGEVAEPTSASD